MAKQVSRELCRRLSLPTILNAVTAMGPLYKLIREEDYVRVILMCRGIEIELKFSDEDTVRDEGYTIAPGTAVVGNVPICIGVGCGRGCGCGCIKDLGYVERCHIAVKLEPSACHTTHEQLSTEKDQQIFTLEKTKLMLNSLLSAYIGSAIERSLTC